MAESVNTLVSPENAVDVLTTQIGLQSTTKPIVQMAAYVGSSYIFDKLLELATGASSISSLDLQGFQLQQMQRDIKTIDKNVKILNSGPSKASLDFFIREDYENAYRSAIEGFRDAADIETKVVATWMKILTETMMKCDKNCDKLGTILKTSLDELLEDNMISECWDFARKQNMILGTVAKRLKSRKNLNQIDQLLSGTYEMLSIHQGWTSPNQDLRKEVSDCVIHTKYIPEGKEDRVSVPIGQLNGEAVRVDLYKTVGNILKCTVFPQADTTPESSLPTISHNIKSRPSKSQKLKIVIKSQKNTKMIEFDIEAFPEDQNETTAPTNKTSNDPHGTQADYVTTDISEEESVTTEISEEESVTTKITENESVTTKISEEESSTTTSPSGSTVVSEMVVPRAEGYFTNDSAFYGPGRKEYLHVTFNNGSWQGLKIVGDTNVPRGKVSFRTLADLNLDINNPTPAEIQIRTLTWNEDGFSWIKGASVRFDSTSDKWIINYQLSFFNFFNILEHSSSFSRVHEIEALNAAKGGDQE